MKKQWKTLVLLFCLSGWLASCQPQKKLVNSYSRSLTEQELQSEISERDAELIVQRQNDQETFVVLDSKKGIQYGSLDATIYEFDDQTSDTRINYALRSTDRNLQAKVDIVQAGVEGKIQQENFKQGLIIAVIRDAAIRQNHKKIKFMFQDQSEIVVPASSNKGIYFSYDALEKQKCTKLELLTESNEVVHSIKL